MGSSLILLPILKVIFLHIQLAIQFKLTKSIASLKTGMFFNQHHSDFKEWQHIPIVHINPHTRKSL